MKKLLLIVFFSAMLGAFSYAQSSEIKDGFAARMYFANYQYQIDDAFRWPDFTNGIEFEYNRKFNDLLSLAIPFRMYRATLPINAAGDTRSAVSSGIDALLTLYPLNKRRLVNPFVFAGLGLVGDDFVSNFHGSAPVGLGFNFYLGKNTFLSTKAGYRFGFEDLRNALELGVGFFVTFGDDKVVKKTKGLDTDGDGIRDSEDLCPTVAGLVVLNGCPDTDGDGVTDGDDNCPNVAGLAKYMGCPDRDGDGVPDNKDDCPDDDGMGAANGCPVSVNEIKDKDNDGVEDDKDACPDVAGKPELMGCPDSDGDGLSDKNDDCPNVAGPRETRGCPDTDGDSIVDKDDNCPTVSGLAANHGCPGISDEDKATLDLAVKAVQFETGSATLKSSSNEILDKVADIMKRYPDHRLAIGGHTDSVGSRSKNQELSEKRAKACYDYLSSKGISEQRMTYKGYGEAVPIADNMNKAGREKNRRVEFLLFVQ